MTKIAPVLSSSFHKNTKRIHGKTIKSIQRQAINCWRINFTDNSHIFLWAEIDGPFNLGQIWLSDKE